MFPHRLFPRAGVSLRPFLRGNHSRRKRERIQTLTSRKNEIMRILVHRGPGPTCRKDHRGSPSPSWPLKTFNAEFECLRPLLIERRLDPNGLRPTKLGHKGGCIFEEKNRSALVAGGTAENRRIGSSSKTDIDSAVLYPAEKLPSLDADHRCAPCPQFCGWLGGRIGFPYMENRSERVG